MQETGDLAEAVTAITATQTASNTDAVLGPNAGLRRDLPTGTVVAAVAAGDASVQTIVTVTDTSVRLKLCKYVTGADEPGAVLVRLVALPVMQGRRPFRRR